MARSAIGISLARSPAWLPRRRVAAGWVLAALEIPAIALVLACFRTSLGEGGSLPLLLLGIVAVAMVGGLYPALVGAIVAFGFADWFLIPPFHTFAMRQPDDPAALATFVIVASVVSLLIDRVARRTVQAARARGEADLRTALLAAVSHDLRAPLAAIKISATSLLSGEVEWSPEQVRIFSTTINEEADRLNALISHLLDTSRLHTGALNVAIGPVALEAVVYAALRSVSVGVNTVSVDVPESLPLVRADPALLERAVANLIGNALAWSPADLPVCVVAVEGVGRIELRVVDRGPGVPADKREAVFLPFQRLDDASKGNPSGIGLGMAVARGFVDAMGGVLALDHTPGGGLTAIIGLAVVGPGNPVGSAIG